MPPFNIMLKPASGLCNMRCRYCFYADEVRRREISSYGIMTEEVLEAIVRRSLEFATGSCGFLFQGGEPTLAGLSFYEKLLALEQKYNVNRVQITNSIQTNGLLLNRDWAAFFGEHRFLVGLSMDGTKELHDANRIDTDGKGTYNRVNRAMQLLRQHRVDFNVLTVVTAQMAKRAGGVYGYCRRNDIQWQQYIPCLDPFEGEAESYSLTAEGLETFLKGLFDCWYNEVKSGYVRYIRYFVGLLNMIKGQSAGACEMNGVCSRQFVLESDGSVYPCDFYMLDEWRLGNLVTDTFEEIEEKRQTLGFMEQSKEPHEDCKVCKWFGRCRGGCRRDREVLSNGSVGKNRFCNAYYGFLDYAYPRLLEVARITDRRF